MFSEASVAEELFHRAYKILYLHLDSSNRMSPSVLSINFVNTDPISQHFVGCFGSGVRVLPNNRNDEPYIYTSAQWDTFSMRVHDAKIRINMRCLIFGGNVYLKLEKPRHFENTCFTDIGGYMYDVSNPVILKGVCGDVSVHLGTKFSRRFFSLTTPYQHPRCCYYDVVLENNCISILMVVTRIGNTNNLVTQWYMPTERRINVAWQGVCTHMHYYGWDSNVYACVDMSVVAKSICNMKVIYHASLIAEDATSHGHALEVEKLRNMTRFCLPNVCYTVPTRSATISWIDAKRACKNQNSSLVSINTEEEWRLITRSSLMDTSGGISFLPMTGGKMFYIGYHTRENEEVTCFISPCLYININLKYLKCINIASM